MQSKSYLIQHYSKKTMKSSPLNSGKKQQNFQQPNSSHLKQINSTSIRRQKQQNPREYNNPQSAVKNIDSLQKDLLVLINKIIPQIQNQTFQQCLLKKIYQNQFQNRAIQKIVQALLEISRSRQIKWNQSTITLRQKIIDIVLLRDNKQQFQDMSIQQLLPLLEQKINSLLSNKYKKEDEIQELAQQNGQLQRQLLNQKTYRVQMMEQHEEIKAQLFQIKQMQSYCEKSIINNIATIFETIQRSNSPNNYHKNKVFILDQLNKLKKEASFQFSKRNIQNIFHKMQKQSLKIQKELQQLGKYKLQHKFLDDKLKYTIIQINKTKSLMQSGQRVFKTDISILNKILNCVQELICSKIKKFDERIKEKKKTLSNLQEQEKEKGKFLLLKESKIHRLKSQQKYIKEYTNIAEQTEFIKKQYDQMLQEKDILNEVITNRKNQLISLQQRIEMLNHKIKWKQQYQQKKDFNILKTQQDPDFQDEIIGSQENQINNRQNIYINMDIEQRMEITMGRRQQKEFIPKNGGFISIIDEEDQPQINNIQDQNEVQLQKIKIQAENHRQKDLQLQQNDKGKYRLKRQIKQEIRFDTQQSQSKTYRYLKYFNLDILQDQDYYKQYLTQILQESNANHKILKTKLLFKFDRYNKTSIHRYVDGHDHFLLLVQTQSDYIVAFYSEKMISPDLNQHGKGLIVSLTNRKIFESLPEKNAAYYDATYLIFGNSQARVSSNELKILSNFGISNAYYDSREENLYTLFGQNQKEIKLKYMQVYQVIFEQ